jgi:hypothetical protein
MTAQSTNPRVKFGILLPTREAVMSGPTDPSLPLSTGRARREAFLLFPSTNQKK